MIIFLIKNLSMNNRYAHQTYGDSFHRSWASVSHTVLLLFVHHKANNHCVVMSVHSTKKHDVIGFIIPKPYNGQF